MIDDVEFAARGNGGLWFGGAAEKALAAAMHEVESGAVGGSETRCAICDGPYAVGGDGLWLCPGGRNPACDVAWSNGACAGSTGDDDRTTNLRRVIKARRLYRETKAEQPTRIFTGVDWGVDGSCCTVRLRREPDGRWTMPDEVFEPAKAKPAPVERRDCGNCALDSHYPHGQPCPGCVSGSEWRSKPAPNPVREWGMKCDEFVFYRQEVEFRRWRDRLRAGKIRAEVPDDDEALVERVAFLLPFTISEAHRKKIARAAIAEVRKTEAGR